MSIFYLFYLITYNAGANTKNWVVNSDLVNHRSYPTPNFANDSKSTGKHQVQMEYFFFWNPKLLDTDPQNELFFYIRTCYGLE